jgi:undecaprenyl-phosphate galactose phosphotransferase/putative colanic acid biosynthesis UDP-glucose lipid carrier transferase
MKKGSSRFVPLVFSSIDILLLLVSLFFAKYQVFDGHVPYPLFYNTLLIGAILFWLGLSLKFNLYEIPRIFFMHKIVAKNCYVLFVFALMSGGLIFFSTNFKFSRGYFGYSLLFFSGLLIAWRLTAFYLLLYYRKKGQNTNRIVLVGLNRNMSKLIDRIYVNPKYGFQIAGLFTDANVKKRLQQHYKGGLSDIIDFLTHHKVDEIIISLPYHQSALINDLFQFADNHMIRVRVIPEFSEYLSQKFSIDYAQSIPILKLRDEPLKSFSNRVIKRVFDVLFSLIIILLIFSWLFPIIALIIKMTSKGPVFFVQERTGQDGKAFPCLKFRSMRVNAESDKLQATKNDSRITPFGAFMRKTSIDELPQIINVLFNHMSLVGPRPHMLKHTEEYRVLVDKFMVRHFAKPGVTGWAQINGYRGETKAVKDMKNRAVADIWYIENWSFLLDVRIVIATAWGMFFKQNENAF